MNRGLWGWLQHFFLFLPPTLKRLGHHQPFIYILNVHLSTNCQYHLDRMTWDRFFTHFVRKRVNGCKQSHSWQHLLGTVAASHKSIQFYKSAFVFCVFASLKRLKSSSGQIQTLMLLLRFYITEDSSTTSPEVEPEGKTNDQASEGKKKEREKVMSIQGTRMLSFSGLV